MQTRNLFMKSSAGDKQRLHHISQAIREIEDYTKNVEADAFCKIQ
jgi:uncharacterized protein with HEPN domain